jgi:hypothetical protein
MKKIIPVFVAAALLMVVAVQNMNSAQSSTRVEKLKALLTQGKLPGKLGDMQADKAFNKASRKADRQGAKQSGGGRHGGGSGGSGCRNCQ